MTISFGPGLVAALALLLALIHPSTCKVNSTKFAGRGFSELPRRPSENCYIRGIRFPQGGPTRQGSKALLSLEEGEEEMTSTVASKVMRWGSARRERWRRSQGGRVAVLPVVDARLPGLPARRGVGALGGGSSGGSGVR